MTTPNPPGRPAGSGEHDGIVKLRVPMREKSAWVKAAQRRGQKLSAWIRDTLNQNTPPTP